MLQVGYYAVPAGGDSLWRPRCPAGWPSLALRPGLDTCLLSQHCALNNPSALQSSTSWASRSASSLRWVGGRLVQ